MENQDKSHGHKKGTVKCTAGVVNFSPCLRMTSVCKWSEHQVHRRRRKTLDCAFDGAV